MNYLICVKLFGCILLLNANNIEAQLSTDETSEGSGVLTESTSTNAAEKQGNMETESEDPAMNDMAPKAALQKGSKLSYYSMKLVKSNYLKHESKYFSNLRHNLMIYIFKRISTSSLKEKRAGVVHF